MSWTDRLDRIISEKGGQTVGAKVAKAHLATLATPDSRAFQNISSDAERRYTYRFRLHGDEGGGIVVTDASDLAKARDSLLQRYGDRLAMVVRA